MTPEHLECLDAMQDFVDRCDQGFVKSTHTYAKFKEIIARHRGLERPAEDASVEATVDQWCRSSADLETTDRPAPGADVQGPAGEVRQ